MYCSVVERKNMLRRSTLFLVTVIILICLVPVALFGRAALETGNVKGHGPGLSTANPNYCTTQHDVGRIVLGIGNYGTFGAGAGFILGSAVNCFTGTRVLSCEFPKGNRSQYLFAAAFWVGAVVGRDTLVSMGADGWLGRQTFHPDEGSFGQMLRRSIMDPTSKEFKGAVSEQDFIAIYSDTFTSGVAGMDIDEIDQTSHIPLRIRVNQNSYAWSYPYAEDFVLFDYSITNIGDDRLRQVYMGIYVDADVNNQGQDDGFDDDICGFIETMNTSYGGGDWIDTVNIAWIADGDGELGETGQNLPVPHVTATRIIRTPSDSLQVSFNWWISNGDATFDFGPQHKEHFRKLSTGGTGTPAGVRNKYAFLKNGEFDYDQVYTSSISPTDPLWTYPNQALADSFSQGYDTRYLLSFGPFNIDPGQTLPLSFAYLAGENLHVEPDNMKDNIQNNYDPDLFYETLDFSDLALNSVWASWIYDNPGVDSDSDGYFGEFRLACLDSLRTIGTVIDTTYDEDSIIVRIDTSIDTTWDYDFCDSIWYVGDGVPDFRGASPPPAPTMWVSPRPGKLHIRWNGLRSETVKDVFSREFDFEGYRVYLGLDNREDSYSVLASYDREDYNKYIFNARKNVWELRESPYTIDQLRCNYGASCDDQSFAPERFTLSSPYFQPGTDSIFYFEPQDFNQSVLGVTTPIRKIYPDQPYPSSIEPDLADASELTSDGYLKYFEYEYWVENLLATVPYYVTVTAFDYGSPQSGLASLETSKSINETEAFASASAGNVITEGLEVFVYPNPYIGDGYYESVGLEGREYEYDNPPAERIRAIHFANLPPQCTITIFSIDGDLIRVLEHDESPSDPTSGHDSWDMVTRNTQAIVSGIYYWTVEDPDGNTQIGKFVVIL